nr:unnamed protein product [Digitaria exilis]
MTNKLLLCVLPAALLLASAGTGAVSSHPVRRYGSIFSFGDSYADTGNAMALGLPFVPPFLTYNGSFRQGANFAVAGATALDASFFSFVPRVAKPYVFNASTNVQLQWFESLKPSLCSNKVKCKGFFHRSLFFMGEFGINDYSFSLYGKNLSQIRSFAPDVVETISTATERVIKEGAKTVVVPGIPPMGCAPSNLGLFPNADPASYDPQTGCLKQLNDLAIYHNSLLQEAIKNVHTKHKDVKVIYVDFFTPIIDIIVSPKKLGFRGDILSCCCGGGGKYNYNISAFCGMPGATVCQDPSAYLYWDGGHFTEAVYRYIAKGWLNSIYNYHV